MESYRAYDNLLNTQIFLPCWPYLIAGKLWCKLIKSIFFGTSNGNMKYNFIFFILVMYCWNSMWSNIFSCLDNHFKTIFFKNEILFHRGDLPLNLDTDYFVFFLLFWSRVCVYNQLSINCSLFEKTNHIQYQFVELLFYMNRDKMRHNKLEFEF